ncbi:MAG: pilus assembly protein TadG-related protein [Gammaproteobacteria bacterium]
MDMKRSLRHGLRSPRRQRGAVMVLVTAGLLAILGIAALALDLGDSYLSKTRLQNALDASALSGAKTLLDGSTTTQATSDAIATFQNHPEVASAGLTPVIEFSDTLVPFSPGAPDDTAKYVRASVSSYPREAWFAAVLGMTGRAVAGSAVAGPVPVSGCTDDILPVTICAKDLADDNCEDGTCYGYPVGAEDEICLKSGSPGTGGSGSGGTGTGGTCDPFQPGAGNFQLLDLGCDTQGGGACVRQKLAGAGGGQCLAAGDNAEVDTEPGNKAGPVVQGINTRFGDYGGGGVNEVDYPPDEITYNRDDDSGFWFQEYEEYKENGGTLPYDTQGANPAWARKAKRRVVALPISDCTDAGGGVNELPVKKIACFYLTKPSQLGANGGGGGGNGGGANGGGGGTEGGNAEIYGQLVNTSECEVSGSSVTEDPPPFELPYKIVLYKDPDNRDS